MSTNRQRAREWLLTRYPSSWEAEHVDELTAMLNEAEEGQHLQRLILEGLMLHAEAMFGNRLEIKAWVARARAVLGLGHG